ncbi:MAG: hypothetical protein KatS3mg132_884 [Limisphaera sp.]|nr:MAG: hypothetical protein KatS3mg132_884 [Limisphaera sp.]
MPSTGPCCSGRRRSAANWSGISAERDLLEDGPFWKLAQALFEVFPRDLEDWKLVSALLAERPTLLAEGKRTPVTITRRRWF